MPISQPVGRYSVECRLRGHGGDAKRYGQIFICGVDLQQTHAVHEEPTPRFLLYEDYYS